MRIIKFLLVSVLVVGGVAGVLALLAREALLVWGVAAVRTEMTQLREISKRPTVYQSQCIQKGVDTSSGESPIESLQLRFISDTEYVLEVVCRQFRLDPIIVKSGQLPMFVTKARGSSGLIWGRSSSAVELEVFQRKRTILVENEELLYENGSIVTAGEGPLSSCSGYGFECCSEETNQGVGDQLTGVTDCPRSCYSMCQLRPVVLSFTSDPFFDLQTRVTELKVGEEVTFSYVIDTRRVKMSEMILEFGDGTTETLVESTGTTTHAYSCAAGDCSYQAKIKATDAKGITAAETSISSITLHVTP